MIDITVTDPLIRRFWDKVDVCDPPSCWLWTGYRIPSGYGQTHLDNRQKVYAHRVSWSICIGPIPSGVEVLHKCDNPPCQNPGHLFLGTQADNVHDAILKGRSDHTFGEADGHVKLTPDSARVIQDLWTSGYTQVYIADGFGVSPSTVAHIVHGRSWKG